MRLELVDLSETRLDSSGQLWLNDIQVTDAGVNELHKSLPNMKTER
ncbi:MAG: hypothetical protein NTY19_26460 [Planctomycetota bacterium]|nr:hypothetical protein [Planctomycetota bacterium]